MIYMYRLHRSPVILFIVIIITVQGFFNYSIASNNSEVCNGVLALQRLNELASGLGVKSSSTLDSLRYIAEYSEDSCGGMNRYTADSYLKLARELIKYEQYDEAEELVLSALQVFSKSIGRSRFYHADALALLATIRSSVGDYKTAKYATDKSLSIRQRKWGASDARLVENLIVSSRIAYGENNIDLAIQIAQEAYKMVPHNNLRRFHVGRRPVIKFSERDLAVLNLLADLYLLNNSFDKAEEIVATVADIVVNLPNVRFQPLAGDILNVSAQAAFFLGNNDSALERINRALDIYKEGSGENTSKYARSLIIKARIISVLHLGSITSKIENEIISLIDRAVNTLDKEAEKMVFISPLSAARNRIDIRKSASDAISTFENIKLHHNSSGALMLEYGFRIAQLLNSTESAKAITKAQMRRSIPNKNLQALVRKYQNLLNNEQIIRGELLEASFTEGKNEQRTIKKDSEDSIDIEAIRNKIEAIQSDYFKKISLRSSSLKELQNTLSSREAILLYLVEKESTYLWVVRTTGITYNKIDVFEEALNDRITRLIKSTRFIQTKEGVKPKTFSSVSAYKLYKWLIEPVKQELDGVDDLFIVPSGPLFSLPFATLITNEDDSSIFGFNELAKAHWLITDYSLTSLPSITTLNDRNTDDLFRGSPRFIGFGDPKLNSSQTSYASNLGGIRSANKRAIFDGLLPLPYTAMELENISKLFGEGNSVIFTQESATEQNLKQVDLNSYDVISFATHGLLSGVDDSSNEAALILTPKDFSKDDSDGLLTSSEISSLEINAELVVLSACDTAVNGKLNAEGISGLATAFYFAGGKSILASHWPVESKTTSILISNLLEKSIKLKKTRFNKALRNTMLEMIRSPDDKYRSHPAYWAAFSLYGS